MLKLSTAGAAGLATKHLVLLGSVGVLALGGGGAMLWTTLAGDKPAQKATSADEAKLAAKGEEQRARTAAAAQRLKQQDLGAGYQFDEQGNLIGAVPEGSDLPQNKALEDATAGPPRGAIGAGIRHRTPEEDVLDETVEPPMRQGRPLQRGPRGDDEPQPEAGAEGPKATRDTSPMLGYMGRLARFVSGTRSGHLLKAAAGDARLPEGRWFWSRFLDAADTVVGAWGPRRLRQKRILGHRLGSWVLAAVWVGAPVSAAFIIWG